jgi:hypothetical protein
MARRGWLKTVVSGASWSSAMSGEKGAERFILPWASPLDSSSWDAIYGKANLPGLLLELEVAWIAGPRWTPATDMLAERGTERNWGLREGCRDARVSCGSGLCFIGARGRRRRSWRGRATGRCHRAVSPDQEVEDNPLPRWSHLSVNTDSVCRLGPGWAGLLGRFDGLRPCKFFPPFFSFNSFSFSSILLFWILIWFPIFFAGTQG